MVRALAVLAAALLAGCCAGRGATQASWLAPLSGPTGSDVVFLDVGVLERPLGDPYLGRALWDDVDEQVVDLDLRARLDDNGLRVGQLGGMKPDELLRALTSERDCPDGRHIRTRSGSQAVLAVGPILEACAFTLRADGREQAVTLSQAQCGLAVTPELLTDGRVRLAFVPQVAHADRRGWAGVAAGAWAVQGQAKPVEKYDALAWSVTLGPDEFAVIGPRDDRADTLGLRCFVGVPPARPVQRVLVVRAGRYSPASDAGAGDGRRPPTLAWQAGYGPVRGTGP